MDEILEGRNTKYLPASTTVYNIDANDDFIFVNTSLNAVTIYLPSIKGSGLDYLPKNFYISDYNGNAATNNITILAAVDQLNSGNSVSISNNYGTAIATIAGPTEWYVTADGTSGVVGGANNGLSVSGTNVQWGGTLIKNTSVNQAAFGYDQYLLSASNYYGLSNSVTPLGIATPGMTNYYANALTYALSTKGNYFQNNASSASIYAYDNGISAVGVGVPTSYTLGNFFPTGITLGASSNAGVTQYDVTSDTTNGFRYGISGGSNFFKITTSGNTTHTPIASTSGSISTLAITNAANTGQTAGANISGLSYFSGTRQWATGAIALQYEARISSPTWSAVAASVMTNGYSFVAVAPTAGANMTITNAWAAGFNGNVENYGVFQLGDSSTSQIKLNNAQSGKQLQIDSSGAGFNTLTFTLGSTGSLTEINTSGPAFSMNQNLRFDTAALSNIYVNNGSLGLRFNGRNDTSGIYGLTISDAGLFGFSTASPTATIDITQQTVATGAVTGWRFTQSANTGQTAATEISGMRYIGGSRQWLTGNFATQRENYWSTTTYTAVAATIITNAYGAYFEAPTASTNVTITNNYAAGFLGNISVSGSVVLTGFTPGSVLFAGTSGIVAQDNTNFFWDDTNNLFSIGAASRVGQKVVRISEGTSIIDIGQASAAFPGIWLQQTTPSTTNYTLSGDNFDTLINGNLSVQGRFNNTSFVNFTNQNGAVAVAFASFTKPTITGQAASTERNGGLWTLGSTQWATGAITTQRSFYITSPTYSFVGTSTIADAYTFYATAPIAGTNATITNNWAGGFSGRVAIGSVAPPTGQRALVVTEDTAYMSMGSFIGTTSSFAWYVNAATPSSSNHIIQSNGSNLVLNAPAGLISFATGATGRVTIATNTQSFGPAIASSGAITPFTFTLPNNNTQTLSTNIPQFLVTMPTTQWATGALTSQYFMSITAPTISFVGASTVTDAYTFYSVASVAGTNATITNNWAAGFDGSVNIISTTTNKVFQVTSTGNLKTQMATDGSGGYVGTVTNSPFRFIIFNGTATPLTMGITGAGGAVSAFTFSPASNTTQTLSTEIPGYNYSAYSRQWATGAIAIQREIYHRTVTYTAVGASIITNSYGMYVEAPTASTNITITNNYGLGVSGHMRFATSTALITTANAGSFEYNGNFYLTNASLVRPSIGGTIKDFFTDTSVGGAETDIYTYTTIANTLNGNGDKIVFSSSGNFVTAGTELTQLKAYFAGTAIWDSTALAPSTGTTSWKVVVEIIRVSSTVIRYSVALTTTGATGYVYETTGELTALTLSGTNIIKITGTSSGVGSGAGDIIGKMGYIDFLPAAN